MNWIDEVQRRTGSRVRSFALTQASSEFFHTAIETALSGADPVEAFFGD